MKKLVIIDDEFYFRKSMYNYLEQQADYQIVGQANHGIAGKELILSLSPDIALVDISMPLLDGLGMIKALHDKTNTHFILLTGYGEFEYARQAIALGVHDYILKPVDYNQLMNSLGTVSHKIDAEQEQNAIRTSFCEYRSKYFRQMDLNIFNKIISRTLSSSEFEEYKEHSPLSQCSHYMVLIIKVTQTASLVWNMEEDADLCHFILENICCELLEQQNIAALYLDYSSDSQYVILGDNQCSSDFAASTHCACRKLIRILEDTVHTPCSLFLGSLHSETDGIRESYEEALSLLRNNNYKNLTTFKAYQDSEARFFHQLQNRNTIRHEMLSALRQKELPKVLALIDDYFDTMKQSACHIRDHQMTALLFITVLDEFLWEHKAEQRNPFILQHALDTYETCESIDALKMLIGSTYQQILLTITTNNSSPQSILVNKAKQYIYENYMDPDLQLKTIASALFVSPQYLSTTFSKEAHVPLSNYVNEVRMQKAKELMLSNSPSIQNTALLSGFTDAGYFSKCFKKYYGISPQKFILLK